MTTTGQQWQVANQAHHCHSTSLDGLWVRQTGWVGGGWSPEFDDNSLMVSQLHDHRRPQAEITKPDIKHGHNEDGGNISW